MLLGKAFSVAPSEPENGSDLQMCTHCEDLGILSKIKLAILLNSCLIARVQILDPASCDLVYLFYVMPFQCIASAFIQQ